MRTPLSIFTYRSAVSDFRQSMAGVIFDAGPGRDFVLGSSHDDDLKGGSGRDALFGFRGDDTLEGGTGLDFAAGGRGDDTFVFRPGDLVTSRGHSNGYHGLVDIVLDFRGAGTSGAGEQDVLRFEGFGAGSTLSFVGCGLFRSLQLYEVRDPTTPGRDGFVFVAMADGHRRLTADDVSWGQATEPTLDLVTANSIANTFSVRLGDGLGGFGGGSDLDVEGGYSTLALGDLDGDGDLDIVTPQNFGEGVGDIVSVLLNDGAGSFTSAPDVAVTEAAGDIALGDLDGDGDLDFVTANYDNNSLGVRLGNGDGTFGGGSKVAAGGRPEALALGDLDGDGDLDVVTANYDDGDGNSASLRLNDGSGTFSGGSDLVVGDGPADVALGDLDGDGDLDLVTTNSNSDSVSVRFNDGNGGFAMGHEVAVGSTPWSIALGDLDGDGDLDFVAATLPGFVSVRLNEGDGTFGGGSKVAVGDIPESVALGDFDGDGDLDLAAASQLGVISVRLNGGDGTFGGGSEVAVGGGPQVALGDLDGPARLTPSGLPDLGPYVPNPAEIDAAWA